MMQALHREVESTYPMSL